MWWPGSQRQAFFGEVGLVVVVGGNYERRPRGDALIRDLLISLLLPPAAAGYRGCWLRALKTITKATGTVAIVSTKIMRDVFGPLPNFTSLSARRFGPRRISRLSIAARAARAPRVHGSPCSSPPALPAATLVTASHCVPLRKPLLPQGGPMERSALGRKLHLSLQHKGGSPTNFRLL